MLDLLAHETIEIYFGSPAHLFSIAIFNSLSDSKAIFDLIVDVYDRKKNNGSLRFFNLLSVFETG